MVRQFMFSVYTKGSIAIILINKLSNSDEKKTTKFHTFITEEITEIELLKKNLKPLTVYLATR